ncbi:diacylglycerol kinase family protein [Desulfovirgula thermocuniculi]|uniref:diacylglycerol kinase family protein n=1 Tax=Desulfovirgula thermocuniculi TaxID=348842 RepID=UPI000423D378|nr:diacylglycerol kinase family protein [Desulfovirgula thermocuniculi]
MSGEMGRKFLYALAGLAYALRTQPNMRFHLLAALAVLAAAFILGVDKYELLFLFLAITLVLLAEMFNTALETVVDLASPGFHPLAKAAKDVAAGAVLLAALHAVATGVVVFYPHLRLILQTFR